MQTDLKDYEEVSKIIDRIQEVRSLNNVKWMDLVRLAMRVAPLEARKIFDEIEENDRRIYELSAGLRSQPAAGRARAPSG